MEYNDIDMPENEKDPKPGKVNDPEPTPETDPESDIILPDVPETGSDVEEPKEPEQSPDVIIPHMPEDSPEIPGKMPDMPEVGFRYRWDFNENEKRRDRRRGRGGILTYAIIMTVAFAVCLTALIGVLTLESGYFSPDKTKTVYIRDGGLDTGMLTVPEIAEKVKPSTVSIKMRYEDPTKAGIASGIIMTSDGYIATNHHVVEDATGFTVVLYDGRELSASVIGSDELSDLAVLKIEADGLVAATFGDSSNTVVGERVVAIGTPSDIDYAGTTTVGYISANSRSVKIYDDSGVMTKRMNLIQTDASVNPGNSGGPLINGEGEVIGIINMRLGITYTGIGFAIPINGAMVILNDIKDKGFSDHSSEIASKRPLIGITAGGIKKGDEYECEDGTKGVAAIDGVVITAITKGSDADTKLKTGDIIVEVEGKSVSTVYDIMEIINNKNGGDTVTVRYYRGGEYATVNVTLGLES